MNNTYNIRSSSHNNNNNNNRINNTSVLKERSIDKKKLIRLNEIK
jgi:hypothetical protein